jgi:uncharacterized protein
MRFIWDEAKSKSNLAKHGYDFADAHKAFAQPIAVQPDQRFHYDEERFIGTGILDGDVVLIVFTESITETRIISIRKATKHETDIYYQEISSN